jgi:hypothetical protein
MRPFLPFQLLLAEAPPDPATSLTGHRSRAEEPEGASTSLAQRATPMPEISGRVRGSGQEGRSTASA